MIRHRVSPWTVVALCGFATLGAWIGSFGAAPQKPPAPQVGTALWILRDYHEEMLVAFRAAAKDTLSQPSAREVLSARADSAVILMSKAAHGHR